MEIAVMTAEIVCIFFMLTCLTWSLRISAKDDETTRYYIICLLFEIAGLVFAASTIFFNNKASDFVLLILMLFTYLCSYLLLIFSVYYIFSYLRKKHTVQLKYAHIIAVLICVELLYNGTVN